MVRVSLWGGGRCESFRVLFGGEGWSLLFISSSLPPRPPRLGGGGLGREGKGQSISHKDMQTRLDRAEGLEGREEGTGLRGGTDREGRQVQGSPWDKLRSLLPSTCTWELGH